MNSKNNQRYQETEKLIQNTLLELAQETEIRKVSVRALCDKAGINRSSFYLHYMDIPDLVDKMGKKMMSDVKKILNHPDNVFDFLLSSENLLLLITYVKEHGQFFDIYLNHYSDSANETFSLLWEHAVKSQSKDSFSSVNEEMWYHFSFFRAGFLAVLGEWLKNDCKESPETLANIILSSLPKHEKIK